jgi:hypothetical protein
VRTWPPCTYVPGPLLAAGLALGVAGMPVPAGRDAAGCAAPACSSRSAPSPRSSPRSWIATFDWRYELPQLSLIPIAAVLGLTALASRAGDRTPAMRPASTDRLVRVGQLPIA